MNNISVNLEKTCSGCGLCESICPVKAISVKEKKGFFRPEINNSCINCGKCVLNCPGRNTNQITSFEMFKYRYYGHSNNDKLRKEAASGGLTTELIKYMLSTGIVDYVITAGEYQNDKNLGYVIIDNQNIDDLDRYSGSNYCPANIGRAIGKIKENNGRYAIVCLPCLARGIFLARKADKLLDSRIKYVITLLCNHIPSYEGTDYLIKRYRIDIPKIEEMDGLEVLEHIIPQKIEQNFFLYRTLNTSVQNIQNIFGKGHVLIVRIILEYMRIFVWVMRTLLNIEISRKMMEKQ